MHLCGCGYFSMCSMDISSSHSECTEWNTHCTQDFWPLSHLFDQKQQRHHWKWYLVGTGSCSAHPSWHLQNCPHTSLLRMEYGGEFHWEIMCAVKIMWHQNRFTYMVPCKHSFQSSVRWFLLGPHSAPHMTLRISVKCWLILWILGHLTINLVWVLTTLHKNVFTTSVVVLCAPGKVIVLEEEVKWTVSSSVVAKGQRVAVDLCVVPWIILPISWNGHHIWYIMKLEEDNSFTEKWMSGLGTHSQLCACKGSAPLWHCQIAWTSAWRCCKTTGWTCVVALCRKFKWH